MQHLDVSAAVRPLKWSLDVKWLTKATSTPSEYIILIGFPMRFNVPLIHIGVLISHQSSMTITSLFPLGLERLKCNKMLQI